MKAFLLTTLNHIKHRLSTSTNPKEKAHLDNALRFLTVSIGFIDDANNEIRTAQIQTAEMNKKMDLSLDDLMREYRDYSDLRVSKYADSDDGRDIEDGDFPLWWVVLNPTEKELELFSQLDKYWAECPYELKNGPARLRYRDMLVTYTVNNLVIYSIHVLSCANHQSPTSDDVIAFMIKTFPIHFVPAYVTSYMMAEAMLPDGLLIRDATLVREFQRYKLSQKTSTLIQTIIEKLPAIKAHLPTIQ
jgi:hypothetical protein